MAFVANIAKGRTVEFHDRVATNDPTNSALILTVLALAGLESDAVLQDYDDLAALLGGTSNQVTNVGFARKTLTDANISVAVPNDTLNQTVLSFATQTFSAIAAGDSWRMLLVCYDSDTTAGTDANIIPMYGIDLLINGAAVVPTGADIIISLPNGYAIAR